MKIFIYFLYSVFIIPNLIAVNVNQDITNPLHFSYNISYSIGPESGYNFFPLGVPKVNICALFYDFYFLGIFGNLNMMGNFISGGFNTGILISILIFEASYTWAKFDDLTYQAFTYFIGFNTPDFGYKKDKADYAYSGFIKLGQSFIINCSDYDHLDFIFFPIDSFYWNIEIGIRIRSMN